MLFTHLNVKTKENMLFTSNDLDAINIYQLILTNLHGDQTSSEPSDFTACMSSINLATALLAKAEEVTMDHEAVLIEELAEEFLNECDDHVDYQVDYKLVYLALCHSYDYIEPQESGFADWVENLLKHKGFKG